MSSGNPNIAEHGKATQWQPGQSGNPSGPAAGFKHIATYIREAMDDEQFEAEILEGYKLVEYKGIPAKAVVRVAIKKALAGDVRWADWLARHGYSMGTPEDQPPDNPISFENHVPVS